MASGQTAFFEIVNTSINIPFTNANNFDLCLRTDQSQQKLLIGNGSNTTPAMTLSNNIVTLANPVRYTSAYISILPSTSKSYGAQAYEYVTFGSANISNSNFFSVNIDPTISYNNTITILQPGVYSVLMQISGGSACFRMAYFANIVNIGGWNLITQYATSNVGLVSGILPNNNIWTPAINDTYIGYSNDVLRFGFQCANTGTLVPYLTSPGNGTSKILIALIG